MKKGSGSWKWKQEVETGNGIMKGNWGYKVLVSFKPVAHENFPRNSYLDSFPLSANPLILVSPLLSGLAEVNP